MKLGSAQRMTTASPPHTDPWQDLSLRLRSMARALTSRDDLADDLAQHTIAHLLARAPDKLTHLGYAHATMTRLWLDDQRARRRHLHRLAGLAQTALRALSPCLLYTSDAADE